MPHWLTGTGRGIFDVDGVPKHRMPERATAAMSVERPNLRFCRRKLPVGSAATADGAWIGYTRDGIMLRVAGTEAGPHAQLAATLWQLVDHVGETMKAIETHAASLPPEAPIAFAIQNRRNKSILARDCGFEIDTFRCEEISVMKPEVPTSALIHFRTALADGYISFRTTIVGGEPGPITVVLS